MKTILGILLLLSLSTLYILLMDKPQRWLMFHGEDAEIYAKELLENKAASNSAYRFVDYVIIKDKGYVTFYKHGSRILYGFFPENTPNSYNSLENKENWQLLNRHWYYYNYSVSK